MMTKLKGIKVKNNYKTIEPELRKRSVIIWLNRPDVHNAFNRDMIKELLEIFNDIENNDNIRSIIISGRGRSFSAGADLKWMGETINYTLEKNLDESKLISELFNKIYTFRKPVIAAINGAAIGGGMGFVAASDIVISSETAIFGLSEVRIGLIPSIISTYLLRKSTGGKLKELFITGRRFGPEVALDAGLINDIVEEKRLIDTAMERADELESAGPDAIAACKELFSKIPDLSLEEASDFTSRLLADLRVGDEAQEGMRSFLEKRDPAWKKSD